MSSRDAAPTQRIVRLVGVYDADSTLRGELQDGLPVPFDTYHRNDQPGPIRVASGGEAPVVVAVTDAGHMLLLAAKDLDACDGSIDRLVEAIEESAVRLGLTWAPA